MSIRNTLTALTGGAGALALTGTILGFVAAHSGPQECEAVIHVTEADVEVSLDSLSFRVDSWTDEPILCSLRGGRHVLRMTRGDRTLYEESFTVRAGEDVVLTAWD